ncbi:MAG TPA: hydroxylamine reductase, partial [Acidobacteriota bacterium]|nr:hydroxylamine reductase [Acidobacteriota bacterium]
MFCYQCEQTAGGQGCNKSGVCGKDAKTAALQDLLLHAAKGISRYANLARRSGAKDAEIDLFVVEALFSTVTNVNFDAVRIESMIRRASDLKKKARALYEDACRRSGSEPEQPTGPAAWEPAGTTEGLLEQAEGIGIAAKRAALGDDLTGLQELLTYGMKGMAAYIDHAHLLGKDNADVYAFIHEGMDYLTDPNPTVEKLFALCMKCGEVNLTVMEMLDAVHTATYGNPVPAKVRITPVKGKAILISGHDLKDLAALLEQTKGTGINVYTHSEMLPAHGYPELKKYDHLAGNYGGAWQDQAREFDAFPGAILMTTNCIQKPRESYKSRIFTAGLAAWPGVTHIKDGNFKPVIDAALAAPGFAADEPEKTILVGFGHNTILGVADKVIDAVKAGQLKRFFLIGGCDGAKPGRNYYTDFAEAVPRDCAILTLACGKYRFNKLEFGDIGGIPRLLDCGQCNDAYSAIKVAGALAQAFGCGVNDLPLSLILSWYEQKACVILLTLLF